MSLSFDFFILLFFNLKRKSREAFKKSQNDDPIKVVSDPIIVVSDPIKQKPILSGIFSTAFVLKSGCLTQ